MRSVISKEIIYNTYINYTGIIVPIRYSICDTASGLKYFL